MRFIEERTEKNRSLTQEQIRTFILVVAFAAISNQASAIDAEKAGASLYKLLNSNYLLESFKKSECGKYIDNKRINNLIFVNNKKIAEISGQLSTRDQEELKRLANSPETVMQFDAHVKTYILDAIAENKNELGGIAFACGVSLGNINNVFIRARQ